MYLAIATWGSLKPHVVPSVNTPFQTSALCGRRAQWIPVVSVDDAEPVCKTCERLDRHRAQWRNAE